MNVDTTWNLLRLALSGIALSLSILTWYVKHFSDELRKAEAKSSGHRIALARSPRVLMILAGVITVLIACSLCASVVWDALSSNVLPIPLRSRGFLLLALCIAIPVIGAILIALVTLSQVGWIDGLRKALVSLWRSRNQRPVDLSAAKKLAVGSLKGRTVDLFPVSDMTLANWQTSIEWVKSNERSWKLGKSFLDSNKNTLVSIVDDAWKTRIAVGRAENIRGLEEIVAVHIEGILVELGVFDATISNRPLQIAKAACAFYADSTIQGKSTTTG